ncbi:MAG: DnaJ domain-containing protein [Thermodesulfobacteriota bacterium]
MEYRYHQGPGCLGWLVILGLFALLSGGMPFFLNLLGALALTGLFGLLLIVAIFWGITAYLRRLVGQYERSQTEAHNTFVFLLVHILVRIAQLDGQVSREEVAIIRHFFREQLRYSTSQMLWIRELMKEALASRETLPQLVAEFGRRFAYEPRLILLDLIYRVIYSKRVITPGELNVAESIASALGISAYDHRTIQARYGKAADDEGRYYETLGVEPGADFAAIKDAYRKLSMKYHPDKVGHLGEEFRKVAEEKMKEINAAYDFLKKKYGQ